MKIRWGSMIPFSAPYRYSQRDIEEKKKSVPGWAWGLGGIGIAILLVLLIK